MKSSNNSYAKVVLDSIGPNGKRLISVEMRYWRAIHAEFMTHRDRARNAASSRAIPFLRLKNCKRCNNKGMVTFYKDEKEPCPDCYGNNVVDNCTYSYIKNDAFFPEFMGAEQKGMQSGSELMEPNRTNCLQAIERMRDFCLEQCKYMYEQGLHKSIINRYLEPFSYITVLTTATEWRNFFRLRVHPKAEKHFNKVAAQVKEAIANSTPQILKAGDWHMPYTDGDDLHVALADFNFELNPRVEFLKRVSAARCARLSYLTHNGIRDYAADLRIFNTLIHPKLEEDRDDDVIHSSPLEHVARASADNFRSGPFNGWFQFRKEFPNENVEG